MGLRQQKAILELLRLVFWWAFWPRYRATDTSAAAAAEQEPRWEWPEKLVRGCIHAIDDMNGTIRGLSLGTPEKRAAWAAEAKELERREKNAKQRQAMLDATPPEEQENYSNNQNNNGEYEDNADIDAPAYIERPSDMKRYFFERYARQFQQRGVRVMHCVWDFIGGTPKIKSIMAGKRFSRPVKWPAGIPPSEIFTSNVPFQNTIHEYIADPTAKALIYRYITEALLDEFAYSGLFSPGCTLVVYSGVYREKPGIMSVPYGIEYRTDGALAGPAPVPKITGLDVLNAEADLCIGNIVRWCMGRHTVAVLSRDTDFLPQLLRIYSEEMTKFVNADEGVYPDPRKYGVFISRKQLVSFDVPPEGDGNIASIIPAQVMVAMPETVPTPPGDDDDDNALDWLEPRKAAVAQDAPSPSVSRSRKPAAAKRAEKKLKFPIREVIDIGELYGGLWPLMWNMHGKCKRCDPIDVVVVLMWACGCDYYRKPNFVMFKDLLLAYSRHNKKIGCLCPRDPEGHLRIDYAAYTRLMALTYLMKSKITCDEPTNYGKVRAILVARKEAGESEALRKREEKGLPEPVRKRPPVSRLPPAHPRGECARLAWTGNYYDRTLVRVPTCGLEESDDGRSLFGYRQNADTGALEFCDDVVVKEVY